MMQVLALKVSAGAALTPGAWTLVLNDRGRYYAVKVTFSDFGLMHFLAKGAIKTYDHGDGVNQDNRLEHAMTPVVKARMPNGGEEEMLNYKVHYFTVHEGRAPGEHNQYPRHITIGAEIPRSQTWTITPYPTEIHMQVDEGDPDTT
jgi:hypothetical protein